MSTVDEWAKREAAKKFPSAPGGRRDYERTSARIGFAAGLVDVAALLLSDEAIDAVFEVIDGLDSEYRLDGFEMRARSRAALEAALTKITEDKG